MNFRTIVEIPQYKFDITHKKSCVFTGSCFAENIGNKISEVKITSLVNPLGIHYNPISLANSLDMTMQNERLGAPDLFEANGLWNSYHFHSSFSKIDKTKSLEKINTAIENYHQFLQNTDLLFVSFGTAYIYELLKSNSIVSNCHKQPEKTFKRRLLSVPEIVNNWTEIIEQLKEFNPRLRIVFTVSPVRHFRDGAANNQISKASLLLAINELCNKYSNISYFPSYEIMNDELRDYRFYADDMIHPSELAIKYILEKFSDAFFSAETKAINKKIHNIISASKHKAFNKNTIQYKKHLEKMLAEIKAMEKEFPNLNFTNEIMGQ